MPAEKSLLVVGGGVTGLCIAYMAAKSGRRVRLIEGSANVGGLLKTFSVGGNPLEHFYHHFFTHDVELQWLLKELDLHDQLVFRKTTMGVYSAGSIHPFDGPADLLKFKPLRWLDKLRFVLTAAFLGKLADWKSNENVAALSWMKRMGGKRVTEFIWEPLLNAKFGKYANEVPLAWLIGRLGQRLRSRTKGSEALGYLSGSLQVLLDRLEGRLKDLGVELITNTKVDQLIMDGEKLVGVECGNQRFEADQVVMTIPSPAVASLIKPHAPALADRIGKVEYFGAVCTILELDQPLSSIYWLNIAEKGFPFGGIIEHTNFIPATEYGGKHVVYLSKYFTQDDPIATMTTEEIEALMVAPLSRIYPSFSLEKIQKVHVFRTRTAATVCGLNFSKSVVEAKLPIEGLFLCNMSHIYPDERSVNNSVRIASELCRSLGIKEGLAPKGSSLSGQIGFDQ